jgi:hypothetical protein
VRIITLRAENVKRLRAVEITPEGDVVVIAGRNAQGKSSVLDAIWMALGGGAGAKETTHPIREGEKKASVTLDLGDLIVTRKWTLKGTTLEVSAREQEDGGITSTTGTVRYSSPQAVLDALIGRLSFDPLAFANQGPKDQLATLLDVVDLPFSPAMLDARRRDAFDARTEVNREVRTLEANLSAIVVPPGAPEVLVSVADLRREYDQAVSVNRLRLEHERARASAEKRVSEAEAELAAARKALEVFDTMVVPDEANEDGLRERLDNAETVNEAVRARQERDRVQEQLDSARQRSENLTADLAAIDKEKADGLAAANLPLEGLSFDEEGVLYNGVPFAQASSAERLRVGIAIAMAVNPQIRVIRITDGSLLDSENMALIAQMAGDNDFQVWIERVDESGKVGVVIEDGEVAS